MRVLSFAFTKHQYRYFEQLKNNLSFEQKNIFFPTIIFPSNIRDISNKLDLDNIIAQKYKEIDSKYKDGLKKSLYKWFIRFQIPWIVNVANKNIKEFNPDIIFLWNGKKFHQAIVLQVAKLYDKKCAFFENGVLPDTTTLDFKGVNATNSIPRDIEFYKNLKFQETQILPQKLIARDIKNKAQTFDDHQLPKRFIFVPFQVGYDTQVILHSPWIKDMFELFDIISSISQKTGVAFVFKEHPSDRINDYSSLYSKTNDKLLFSTISTQELIQKSQAVLTINSSVAIESLLFHKKVIVLGEAFFAIDGIVKVVLDFNQLLDTIKFVDQHNIDTKTIDNFLKYLKYDYLIPKSWRSPNQEHFKAIKDKILKEIDL